LYNEGKGKRGLGTTAPSVVPAPLWFNSGGDDDVGGDANAFAVHQTLTLQRELRAVTKL
jgi:hypothetical protein